MGTGDLYSGEVLGWREAFRSVLFDALLMGARIEVSPREVQGDREEEPGSSQQHPLTGRLGAGCGEGVFGEMGSQEV